MIGFITLNVTAKKEGIMLRALFFSFQVNPDDVINRKISLHKYGKQEDLKERDRQR